MKVDIQTIQAEFQASKERGRVELLSAEQTDCPHSCSALNEVVSYVNQHFSFSSSFRETLMVFVYHPLKRVVGFSFKLATLQLGF